MNLDCFLFAVMLASRRKDCLLDPFEHDLLVNTLISVNRIHDPQELGPVHCITSIAERRSLRR